jgi:hypothetical protein
MSHVHFCEVTGHKWQCEGTALRPLTGDTEPSICMCDSCQVPMELGDHSGCMIELLACPAHMDEQLRAMQDNRDYSAEQVREYPEVTFCFTCGLPLNTHDYEKCMGTSRWKRHQDSDGIGTADPSARPTEEQDEPLSPAPHCECGCADADPEDVTGWCFWCDHVYVEYTRTTEDQHFARHCPDAPEELRENAKKRLLLDGEGRVQ